jgi:hypothetical protein
MRGAFVLPPFAAGRCTALDLWLARLARPLAGMIAFSLDARAAR